LQPTNAQIRNEDHPINIIPNIVISVLSLLIDCCLALVKLLSLSSMICGGIMLSRCRSCRRPSVDRMVSVQ